MTLPQLVRLVEKERDYEELVGQLWIERKQILERINAAEDPRAAAGREIHNLRRRVAGEGTGRRRQGRARPWAPDDLDRLSSDLERGVRRW